MHSTKPQAGADTDHAEQVCPGEHSTMIAGLLALTAAAVFSGAAFYINFVEQPARMQLEDGPLLTQWKPAYKRGFMMQASLAVFGFLLGLLAAFETSQILFLAGAVLMLANWPWTVFFMFPLNDRLMTTPLNEADAETRSDLTRWNKLHGVRTVLGSLAVIVFFVALSKT